MIKEELEITEQEHQMFDYLNSLRLSGETNMFGATPYLAKEFNIEPKEARKVLSKWMENFNKDGYAHLR